MSFDADEFMRAAMDQPLTDRPLLPSGDYLGIIESVKPQSGPRKTDPSITWYALNIQIGIDTNQKPGVKELVGQDKIMLFHFVGLDILEGPDGKEKLDSAKGKNRQLKPYLEALGMNQGGFTPAMLIGKMVNVRVGRGEYDKKPREEVEGIGKVA